MRCFTTVAAWVVVLYGSTGAAGAAGKQVAGLPIADRGKALAVIVRGAGATVPERTAVRELATYLNKVTGATFDVVDEAGVPKGRRAIHVGHTQAARSAGIDLGKLGGEESVLRSVPAGLVLTGGRPRGTLYAVYTFLEDVLGCRWYAPGCERVPHRPTCAVPPIDRRVVPAFVVRDTYTHCHDKRIFPFREEWKWHVIRNRFNGASIGAWVWGRRRPWSAHKGCSGVVARPDSEIGPGWSLLGGPHSFFRWVPADKYFKDHPEYFSMRKGRRVPGTGTSGNHLCLTNQAMRRVVIENVKQAMREFPEMRIFSVCMNDGGCQGACNCPTCEAFAKRHSWTDLHVDFINTIADGIAKEFPDNYIYTLAYSYASFPPKHFRYRDNVIVQACLLTSNQIRLPQKTGPGRYTNPALSAWTKWASYMWIWDYAQPGGMPVTFLQPMYDRMQEGYRLAKRLGAKGVFAENELMSFGLPMVPEFYGMRLWLMAKLMQDPDQDLDALITDFTGGYYGPAGAHINAYITLERQRLHLWPMHMVDLAFVTKAQSLFDQAERAVHDQPEYLNRVRTARIWSDLAALFFRSKLHGEFIRSGGKLDAYPYKTAVLKQRVLAALETTKNLFWHARYPHPRPRGKVRKQCVEHTAEYVEMLCRGRDYCPLPKPFADLPPDRVFDVPGYQVNHGRRYKVVDDPDSVFGLALCGEHSDEMPVHMGVYDLVGRRGLVGRLLNDRDVGIALRKDDIKSGGYRLYKLGRTIITTNCYAWLTQSWQIQHHLEMLHDPTRMDRKWDIYVSVKLTGPSYPHGKPGQKDAIWFDRMILVKVAEPGR